MYYQFRPIKKGKLLLKPARHNKQLNKQTNSGRSQCSCGTCGHSLCANYKHQAFLPNLAAEMAAELSAVRWIGCWPCSEPARSSNPSGEASIRALSAAISAANVAPLEMLKSPPLLAEKAGRLDAALVTAAEMAAQLSAARWMGGSAESSIWVLMAVITAVNVAPSGMLESPTALTEKFERLIRPISFRKRQNSLRLSVRTKMNRKEKDNTLLWRVKYVRLSHGAT